MQGEKISSKNKDANTGGAGSAAKRSYSYLIEFRCRGTLVFSEKTDQMGECVTIGHDPKNDWVIPPEDKTAADFHAQLHLGPRDASIVACKGENFRYRGKIAKYKIAQICFIRICVPPPVALKQYHRLFSVAGG